MMTLLSRRGDSNTRPPRPERGALPTALLLAHFQFASIILSRQNLLDFTKAGAKVLLFFDICKLFCTFFTKNAFCGL